MGPLTRREDIITPEFAVIHPGYMWKTATRYVWASATDEAHKDCEYFPYIVRVDMSDSSKNAVRWSVPDEAAWIASPPLFLPRSKSQSPDSADGVVLVLLASHEAKSPVLTILDAATMQQVASMTLPLP